MTIVRSIAAFVAGLCLYYVSVVFVGGMLAAVAAPKGYFAYFGREHLELAHAVLFTLGWAIPVAVLVSGGLLAVHRLLSTAERSIWPEALAGMLASFLFWALVSGEVTLGEGGAYEHTVLQALRSTFPFAWWGVPNFFAPWLGFAFAVWLIARNTSVAGTTHGEA